MLQLEILVSKFWTVNGLSTGAVVVREISTLDHEPWDDSMEITPCIPESVLVSSQLTKIARRSWNFIVEKLKYNATGRCGIDGNVKEYIRLGRQGSRRGRETTQETGHFSKKDEVGAKNER